MPMGDNSRSNRLKPSFPVSPSKFFNKNKKPTLRELQAWEDSFQVLLEDRNGRVRLREFMKSEYSEENLDFYLECEEFIKASDEKKRKTKARKIFDEFISSESQKEINVDSQTRDDISRRIASAPPDIFTEAQRRIYHLMEKDIFPRFCRSSAMRQMKDQAMAMHQASCGSSSPEPGSSNSSSTGERIRSAPSRLISSMMKAASMDMTSQQHSNNSPISTSNISLDRGNAGSDAGSVSSNYLGSTLGKQKLSSSTASSSYQLKYSDEHLTISRV